MNLNNFIDSYSISTDLGRAKINVNSRGYWFLTLNIGLGNGVYVKLDGTTTTKHSVRNYKDSFIDKEYGFQNQDDAFECLKSIATDLKSYIPKEKVNLVNSLKKFGMLN